jgi:chloramphenicol-sensitive protein RarD
VSSSTRQGLLATICAFLIWGVLPLYLRVLRQLPALEIMSHRVLWACVLIYVYLCARGQQAAPLRALRDAGVRNRLIASSLLVCVNWLVFVWAVSEQRTMDASLGYFINPLLNVLLGVLVLRERLRPVHWVAIAFATAGVTWLTVALGELPWLSLVLATSFAGYGLIRKLAAVEAVVGLAAETTLITPFALAWLVYHHCAEAAPLPDVRMLAWLVLGGLITSVPLALFAYGARLIPLSTVGLIQYLAPSMQFACGLLFGEPFSPTRAVGFGLIWFGLAVFASEEPLRRGLSRPRSGRGPGTTPP